MLVSLSDVLTSEGKVETVAIPLEMTSFKSRQGDFSIMEKTPIHLTFTNIGDAPLVIHQAVASCGCTVPDYTKEPIQPGKTGTIKVTYNGTGKYPGHFKKSITLRTNAKTEMMRIYIEGNMTAKDAK